MKKINLSEESVKELEQIINEYSATVHLWKEQISVPYAQFTGFRDATRWNIFTENKEEDEDLLAELLYVLKREKIAYDIEDIEEFDGCYSLYVNYHIEATIKSDSIIEYILRGVRPADLVGLYFAQEDNTIQISKCSQGKVYSRECMKILDEINIKYVRREHEEEALDIIVIEILV